MIDLGAADVDEILAVKRSNAEKFNKRLQIGIGRRVPPTALQDAAQRWERVPGGVAAHWNLSSKDAKALRLGLDVSSLPRTAELRFAGIAKPGVVYGPFSADEVLSTRATYWSPVLDGDRAILEVFVADGESSAAVSFAFSWVSHIFASPADANVDRLAKVGESQFCEVDLVCRSNSDAALATIGTSVARVTFSNGLDGGTSLCTGTLLNTTSGPVAPYFFSAAHCIHTQASASTLTTHWFFDRTGCGSGTTSSAYVQVAGGAVLLYADVPSDVLLMRLNQSPPQGAAFGGWDSSPLGSGTAITSVHHPAGDWKKVSLGSAGGFSGYLGVAGDNHIIALWNSVSTGVTEGGSSGSGIFTAAGQPATDYRLRGGLHGGPSSCSATGIALRDYYSRFDQKFSSMAQYLNPPAGCSYSLSQTGASVGADVNSGAFTVTAGSGCAWSATSNSGWLTTSSSGSGSGTVSYSVAVNTGTARTGTITVAGQSFTLSQQAGQVGPIATLIVNGGFESGASGWTQSSTSGLAIISTGASAARSGSGYAWLGGYVSGTDVLSQNVTIAADATQASLQFWYRIGTNETATVTAFDTMTVRVIDPSSGSILSTLLTLSNLNASTVWRQSSAYDLTGFRGRTVRIEFRATNDFSNITNFLLDDIALSVASATGIAANYTSLWWNPAESGWGLNLVHQGDTIFGSLFTYDSTGAPMWLFMSNGARVSGTSTYSGRLYRAFGPPFNANPFRPITVANLTDVGSMTIAFSSMDAAALTYTMNGVRVDKAIQRQVFASRAANCFAWSAGHSSLANYQDLWWNPNESGWGLNLTHQDNVIFGSLFTYGLDGRGVWYFMSAGIRQSDGSYRGELYRATGPAFNAQPFNPITAANLTQVGTMTIRFTDGASAQLTYSVNGITVVKSIVRQVFASPATACN